MNGGGRRNGISGAEIGGLILITVGVIALLRNFDIVDVAWSDVWPIILVLIGAAIVVSAFGGSRGGRATSIPIDGASRLDLDMKLGAGRFRLLGGSAALVDIASARDDVADSTERAADAARVRLRQDFSWFRFWSSAADWTVRIADGVETRLEFSGGAGDFDVDLRTLRVAAARLSVGAAQFKLALPRPAGDLPISISAGASSVTIEVPAGVEARIVPSGGLLNVNGRTETRDYDTASDRVTVTISGGASSIRVLGT